MVTKTEVKNYLQQLEIDEGITIFYCILGGSRSFNNRSSSSDWDIFFVFDGIIPYIRRDEIYNNEGVTFKGYRRDIHTEYVQKGIDFYMIDNLRAIEIYYDTESYHTTLLNSIDYNMDEGGRTVFENIVYRIKRHIINNYMCILLAGSVIPTKKYRVGLYLYVRYLWIIKNNSILYPLDRNILLKDVVNEAWYVEAINIFSITDEFTSRNDIIDKILEQVVI